MSQKRRVSRGSAKLRTGAYGILAKALERGLAVPLSVERPSPGGSPVPFKWLIKYAGNCTAPHIVEKDGVPLLPPGSSGYVFGRHPMERPLMLDIQCPCRQCDSCLRRRAAHWRLRSYREYRESNRTWFGTLTLNPEQHFKVLSACRMEASRNGDDFDLFDRSKQFAARHRCISREITLYVNRLRKANGWGSLRFLCVVEEHKNGLPHYHMLVHEVSPHMPIRHKTLSEQWRVGFSQWKLVTTPQAAGYVTKYLAKSIQARVRASVDYGKRPQAIVSIGNV